MGCRTSTRSGNRQAGSLPAEALPAQGTRRQGSVLSVGPRRLGERSHAARPINLTRPDHSRIGSGVHFGPGCWLQKVNEDRNTDARVAIGGASSPAGHDVISAARRMVMEPGVVFARHVHASNHSHSFDDPTRHIHDQGVDQVQEVLIEAGARLRQDAVCPAVHMGRGAATDAGSVVRGDVTGHSVAVGAPARVVKQVARV